MTAANHPKNEKRNGPHDLGQISRRQQTFNAYFNFVVVESPGTEFEKIVMRAARPESCRNWLERHYTDDFCPAEVMKQLPNGELTTEF